MAKARKARKAAPTRKERKGKGTAKPRSPKPAAGASGKAPGKGGATKRRIAITGVSSGLGEALAESRPEVSECAARCGLAGR